MATPNPFLEMIGYTEPEESGAGGINPEQPLQPKTNPFLEMAGYQEDTPEVPPEELGTFGNLWAGLKERGASLVGDAAGFAQSAGQNLETAAGVLDWVPQLGGLVNDEDTGWAYLNGKEWEKYNQDGGALLLRDFQDDWKNTSYGFTSNSAENWETVKSHPDLLEKAMALGAFSLEVGAISLADMAGAVLTPAPYLVARAEEIANERAASDGRDASTPEDLSVGFATSAIITAMERFGFEQIAAAFVRGGSAAQKILRGVVGEGGTEFVQEQLEYGAETLGTKSMPTTSEEYWAKSLERGLQGAAGGGPVGGAVAAVGAAFSPKEEVISPDVKSIEENADAITRALDEKQRDEALAYDDEAVIQEAEGIELENETKLFDIQQKTFPTNLHAQIAKEKLGKEIGTAQNLEAVQTPEGEWVLRTAGMASAMRLSAERQANDPGLRPTDAPIEVTEIPAETITEPNPTTEGIEVEEITTRGVAAPVEGIEVTELAADEEIEMRRGSIYTGDDQVIPPTAREWHGATQKEVEQEMGAEVWDNGALAQRAVDKIKEHFPDSKVETALIDGEWKIVPPGRASIERVKNARAKDQGLLRPPKKPPDDDDPPPPSGGGAPPPGGAPVAPRSKEDVESELADVKAELEQQPRNQDIDATTDPETIGKVQNLLKRQQELTDERDTGLTGEALTDERSRLRGELTKQRKGMGRKYETVTSMREKLGDAEPDTTGVVSAETPAEQTQVAQTRTDKRGNVTTVTATIEKSVVEGVDTTTTTYSAHRDDGRKLSLGTLNLTIDEFTDQFDISEDSQEFLDEAEDVRIQKEISVGEGRFKDNVVATIINKDGSVLTEITIEAKRKRKPETPSEQTQKTKPAHVSQPVWDARDDPEMLEELQRISNAMGRWSMDKLSAHAKKNKYPRSGPHGNVRDNRSAIIEEAQRRFMSGEWKQKDRVEQEPETPTTTSTDVLPDGTEYDLSHTKDTQVPNTVGTYDKVKDEYFGDVDNGDILDYGAGMGLAAKKHGFESLEPYPTGWEPDYFTADEIDRQYDGIIMNNVLNVLPKHTRHVVLADAAKRKLSPGGRLYINVRSRGDVMGQKETAKKVFSESEILTQRNTYQKGFQRAELIKYLERELGDGYTVESAKFGSIGVLVTKAAGPSTTAEGGTLEARLDALPVNKEYAAKLKAELDEKNRVAQLQSQKKQPGWEQPIEDEFEYTPLDETNPQFQQLSDEGKDEVRRIKREMAYYHQKDPKHEELMLLQYELQRLVERELGKPEPTKTGIWALDQDTEKYPPAFSLYGKKLPAATRAYGAEYMERTKQHPLMDDVRILMNPQQKNPEDFALLEIEAFGSDGGVLVKTIQSSRAGKGNGNAGVNFLLDLANEHGVDLMLDPQAYGELEGRLNQKQLEGWYKRKGFEPMPDYEGMMIYRPLVKAEPETVSDLRAEEREESLRTMTETTQPKTLKELREHPLVDEIVDERSEDNGYWVYLKPGWRSPSTDTGSIHEMTVKELLKDFAGIYQTKEEAPAPTGPVEKKGNRLYINGKAATKWDVLTLMERDYANHPAEHLRGYESVMTVDEVLEFFNRRYLASLEPTQTETTDTEAQQVMDKYAKTRPELAGAIMSHKPGDDRKGNTLVHYYGEFLMTEDKDGMPVDLVLNQEHDPKTNTPIYIVNAATEKGAFEQHKVMLGFKDEKDAQEGFDENWPGRPVKSVERITPEAFQEWKVSGDTKREYNREQWTGRMNKNVPLDRPAPADNVLTPEELAAFPASAITSVSPWILADGSVVETGTDHVGYAAERGIISRKKNVSQVANFQQKAKAVRAAFSSDTIEAVTFAWMHLHDKQKLNDAQIDTLARFFEETEKLGKKPAVIIGRSPDGNNPKTTRINSIEDLRAWNDGKELSEFSLTSPPGTVKEPTPEYGDTTDDLLRDAGRGDLAWGPVPESTPLTPEELAERPQQEGPAAPVDWEPVPELERPPIVDIGGVLDASAAAPEGVTSLADIPLTAEDGDTRITHNAKWWKDAIDERLTNLNKLRGCA